jgi:hypothetical protein
LKSDVNQRRQAIAQWLKGASVTDVCAASRRSRNWFCLWQRRREQQGLQGLHRLREPPAVPHNPTPPDLGRAVITARRQLVKRRYHLVGAPAIRQELADSGIPPALPPYPPPSARQSNEVDQLDTIGPRYLCNDRTGYYFLALEDAFDGAFEAEFSDSRWEHHRPE